MDTQNDGPDVIDNMHPPRFDGTNFAVYKQKVQLWTNYTSVAKPKQGGLLLLNCHGKANDIISSIDNSEISKDEGVRYFLGVLESVYGEKSDTRDLISLYSQFRNLSRGSDSCSTYIANFLRLSSKLSRRISPKMLDCLQLITGACMSEDSLSQFLTIFVSNGSPWEVDQVATILKQVLPASSSPESHVSPVMQVSKPESSPVKGVARSRYGYGRVSKGKGRGKGKNRKGKGKSGSHSPQYGQFQSQPYVSYPNTSYSGKGFYPSQPYRNFSSHYSGKGKSFGKGTRFVNHVSEASSQYPESDPHSFYQPQQYSMPGQSQSHDFSELPLSPVFY